MKKDSIDSAERETNARAAAAARSDSNAPRADGAA